MSEIEPDPAFRTGIAEAYATRTQGSARLRAKARDALPGGITTDARYFEPYSVYVERAAGVEKWDVDGNVYLDFFGGHGANMLGHAHPVVVTAVQTAIGRGIQFAASNPLEVALAQRVKALIPSAERVRFAGSGTEATLLALRLARAFTGRSKILRFATLYHGWHDHTVSGVAGQFDGGPTPGVLPAIAAETILIRPGDSDALARAFDRHGHDIAAVMVTAHGVLPTSADFLHSLASAARNAGAIFILDEVFSGFRFSLGGAQKIYGLRPDLTTLAKVLCGAMPGGAVAGRKDIMDMMDHDPARRGGRAKVIHQGTFSGNPVSMAAGLATLEELERIDGCTVASMLGEYARAELNRMSEDEGLPFTWYGEHSLFHLLVRDGNVPSNALDLSTLPIEAFLKGPRPMLNRFRMALNVLGMDVNNGCSGLLSAVHRREHVDRFVIAVARAAHAMRKDGVL